MSENIQVQEFVAHSTQVNCAAIGQKSNQVFATGGEDTKVNIWRVGSVSNIWTLGHNKSPIESLCFDSDEYCVVSGAFNGSLKVYDLNEGKLARNLGSHQVSVTSLQYHPFGEFLVSGSADCTMKFWDVRNKSCVETYTGHKKEITCVRFSPDGKWVASASKDGQILFYDLVASKHIDTIRIPPSYVTSFAFNPTEFSLAAVTSSRAIRCWDLETMKPTYNTPPESSQIKAITFSNIGNTLFSTAKSSLKIWDIENNCKMLETLDIGWDNVNEIAISNNDLLLGIGYISNFVSVWEVDLSQYLGNASSSVVDDRGNVIADNNRQVGVGTGGGKAVAVAPQAKEQSEPARGKNVPVVPNDDDYLTSDPVAPGKPALSSKTSVKELPPSDLKSIPEEGDFKGYYDDEKSIPEVVHEEGHNSIDMATSMGESFWKRFKDGRAAPSELPRERNDRQSNLHSLNEAMDISNALEQMLPPSSYGDDGFDDFEEDDVFYTAATPTQQQQQAPATAPSNANKAPAVTPAARPPSNKPPHSSPPLKSNQPSGGAANVRRADAKEANNNKYNMVGYHNIQDVETKGLEGLEIVGSKHQPARLNSAGGNNVDKLPLRSQTAESGPSIQIYASPRVADNAVGAVGGAFGAGPSSSSGAGNESAKCNDYMDKLLSDSNQLAGNLAQRLATLKILRQSWSKGEVMETLDHLQTLADAMKYNNLQNISILSDFFSAIELKNQNLTLDACLKLLPIIEDLLQASNQLKTSTNEVILYTVFKSLTSMLAAFGELIRSTRATMSVGNMGGMVDLTREARLNKCNVCYDVFSRVKGRVDMVKYQFRNSKVPLTSFQNGQTILDVLEQYSKLSQQYLF
jgi:hypothetical protein